MRKKKYFHLTALIFISQLATAQINDYTQKKEYGLSGTVKSVSSYMVHVSKYQIPSDTLNHFSKSVMNFTKKGDVTTYQRIYNLPNYQYNSKAVYNGTGRNISYKETSHLNKEPTKNLSYQFVWNDDFNYKIISKNNEDKSTRSISLNKDFSIDKVIFTNENYHSEEKATYSFVNGLLEKIIYKVTVNDNGKTTESTDIRLIKYVDVYNNPTVIYFYEKADGKVPKSVVFKYYEYY